MARMYRETVANLSKTLVAPATAIYSVSPIDADQIPNGYLKTVKISVNPSSAADTSRSYMIVASTSANPADDSDYITGAAVPRGGGTVWLNLKRPVKASVAEENRPDGVVFFHVLFPGGSPVDPAEINFLAEAWGRFVNLASL